MLHASKTVQDLGSRSKHLALDLALRKVVEIRRDATVCSGRTVAEVVFPDGLSLNQEMVRSGLTWHYLKYAPTIGTLRGSKPTPGGRSSASGASPERSLRGTGGRTVAFPGARAS